MHKKYAALLAEMETDTEYQAILQDYHCADRQLRQFVRELNPAQQQVIYEYLGTLAELQMREIELALMLK